MSNHPRDVEELLKPVADPQARAWLRRLLLPGGEQADHRPATALAGDAEPATLPLPQRRRRPAKPA
jgi:hypothetical protein